MTFNIENLGKVFNICNLYILLWCIYFAQDGLSIGGTIITQLIFLFNLMITLYTFVRTMIEGNMPFSMKILGLLILLFTIYGMEPIIFRRDFYIQASNSIMPSFGYLVAIYISIVPVFAYYYFTKRGFLTEKIIKRWIPIFLITSSLVFRGNIMKTLEWSSKEDEITNNAGYLFLALIPALVFYKKLPLIQYTLLAITTIMMLVAVKRGALVIGILTILWVFAKQFSDMTKRQRLMLIFTILIFVGSMIFVIIQLVASNPYFVKRFFDFLDGNSSSRDVLYAILIDYFFNLENPIQIMFGSGANATLEIGENLAHNDWIEILINQGIFGTLIYAVFWISFGLYVRKSKQSNNTLHTVLGALFIIYLMKTFFSMSYTDIAFSASPVLGYCFAKSYQIIKENEDLHNIPELSE